MINSTNSSNNSGGAPTTNNNNNNSNNNDISNVDVCNSTHLQTIAGLLGNVLEWYDFAMYGYFSDTISQVFFPPPNNGGNGNAYLVYSYLIFGLAFLCRPLGGVVAGHIGDAYGRKRALVFSMSCMICPTVLMGCLPTYSTCGGLGIALLAACRCLQGFSVGGQLISSVMYTVETKPMAHWGYYGSFIDVSSGCGVLLANMVSAILRSTLNDAQLVSWGWRVAFMSGILIAPAAVFLNCHGVEHHPNEGEFDDIIAVNNTNNEDEFDDDRRSLSSSSSIVVRRKRPITEALKRENWLPLLASILTPMLGGAGYYVTFIWMAVYMETLLDPPVPNAYWVNLFAYMLGLLPSAIVSGIMSDRYGRHVVMTTGAICVGLIGPIMIYIISRGQTWPAFAAQWTIGVLLSMFTGPMWAWITENFDPKVRLTSAAMGYNLSVCLSAGFSPALATVIVNGYGPVSVGIIYPMFASIALVGLVVSVLVQRRKKMKLDKGTTHHDTGLILRTLSALPEIT